MAPTVAIVVPYRGGEPHRDRNWQHVRYHYELHHPTWPILTADSPGPWSKGAAIAAALEGSTHDTLILADADSLLYPDVLPEALALVEAGTPWVVPHDLVHRLTPDGTESVLAGAAPDLKHLVRPVYTGPAGGGIVVLSRSTYDAAGGIDPRFLDWGGEDTAFALALETLVGPHRRIGADLVHLWHPHPSPDHRKPPASDDLFARYAAARWHPGQMRAVIAGTPYTAPEPLSAPRRFRCPTPIRTVRCGTVKARFRDHQFETCDPDLAEAVARMPNVEEVP